MSCDHRGTQTVTEIVTTEDAGGDRIGDATRLSSCDGETVENEKVDVSKSLFFPIPGMDARSFKDDLSLTRGSEHDRVHYQSSSRLEIHGKVVRLNGHELALFCYKEKFYAVNERCPHMGGPLHLGDIEELPGGDKKLVPHIICPWHKWCFELGTGKQVQPTGRHSDIETFPVKVSSDSGKLCIGFVYFDPTSFTTCDF